jgi:hypothetical protein
MHSPMVAIAGRERTALIRLAQALGIAPSGDTSRLQRESRPAAAKSAKAPQVGKKQAAQEEAAAVASGDSPEWGADLTPGSTAVN